jgi:iron(III) transport system permease protein
MGTLARPSRGERGRAALFAAAAVVPTVVVFLLCVTFWMSVRSGSSADATAYTLENYRAIYTDPFALVALGNTVMFAVVSTAVALAFGVPIGWLTERTSMSGKPLVYALMVLGMVIPASFVGMGWILLAHPRIGFANVWLRTLTGLPGLSINITSVGGMGFVQGLSLGPLTFIMAAAAFRSMNPLLEEAAMVHGMQQASILRRITLPLAAPAIAAATIYVFAIGVAAFDIPAIMGLGNRIYTFSTFLYQIAINSSEIPNYNLPAAVAIVMVAFAFAMTLWYSRFLRASERYEIISGRSYLPKTIALTRWRNAAAWSLTALYLLLSAGLPLLLLAWVAFLPYSQPPSPAAVKDLTLWHFRDLDWPTLARAAVNSTLLMLFAPIATVAFGIPLAWVIVRSRSRLSYGFEFLSFLPHAMPPIVFALAALIASLFIVKNAIPLYGTVALIGIVYVVESIAFVTRVFNTGLMQIHRELEEVGLVSGLGLLSVLWRITLPLLLPTIAATWFWRALVVFRELPVASTLFTPSNITVPVMIWNVWTQGGAGPAAAVTLILVAALAPLTVIYWLSVGRRTDAR